MWCRIRRPTRSRHVFKIDFQDFRSWADPTFKNPEAMDPEAPVAAPVAAPVEDAAPVEAVAPGAYEPLALPPVA